ncbi:MAG: Hsp33 family molecular chaperone HslO [Burkholderiaceae bacterium]|nr:Hsp33 family molecular chaperone HslO [Burkholderiaceae bacterium]
MSDRLLKFLFADAPVRGEIVRLETAWRRIVEQHGYPAPVTRLLGEMTAATALLAANLKFDGTLILQILGDGPVRLLVVECASDLRLRATAKLRDGVSIGPHASLRELVNMNGQGRCALLLEMAHAMPGQQPYQGIVSLQGETVAQVLQNYLKQSEQLESRLWLAADDNRCAGLLLQKLPREGGRIAGDEDAWERAGALAATVSEAELLALPPLALAQRLFWQERLEPYAPLAPRFECRCSRERIERMQLSLGRAEVEAIVAERGAVEVTCDFCNARQRFDAVDVAQLFATGSTTAAGSASH